MPDARGVGDHGDLGGTAQAAIGLRGEETEIDRVADYDQPADAAEPLHLRGELTDQRSGVLSGRRPVGRKSSPCSKNSNG